MYLTTEIYFTAKPMTYIHFTLETKGIQSLIDKYVEDNSAKSFLTTVFNQLI